MIFAYNKEHVGDILMVVAANPDHKAVKAERKRNIARIFIEDSAQTVGWNFFEISALLPNLKGKGQIFLSDQEVQVLNNELKTSGFEERIVNDNTPKFVIGLVKELVPHPDSDHLKIAQIEVDQAEVLQIVVGAPNVEIGQKVVVAKPYAMMPDGTIIWPGVLRGVESNGMLSSPRELNLPNAPQVRGILVLPENTEVGIPFNPKVHWQG